jgi:hypothetical protein
VDVVFPQRASIGLLSRPEPAPAVRRVFEHATTGRAKPARPFARKKQADNHEQHLDDSDRIAEDALDMIAKLAESERAEQVFVRHAFLYRKVESGNRPMSLP